MTPIIGVDDCFHSPVAQETDYLGSVEVIEHPPGVIPLEGGPNGVEEGIGKKVNVEINDRERERNIGVRTRRHILLL